MSIRKQVTAHAEKRLQQRGLTERDIDFILRYGSEVPDGYLLTRQDRAEIECQAKRLMGTAQRLTGKRLVVDGKTVVTAFHADRKQQKKLL